MRRLHLGANRLRLDSLPRTTSQFCTDNQSHHRFLFCPKTSSVSFEVVTPCVETRLPSAIELYSSFRSSIASPYRLKSSIQSPGTVVVELERS
jgi:hypothetical protein